MALAEFSVSTSCISSIGIVPTHADCMAATAPQALLCPVLSAEIHDKVLGLLVPLQQVDNLEREKAFFKGPSPVLLSSTSPDDLTFLLLGSDPKTSQVHIALACSGHTLPV